MSNKKMLQEAIADAKSIKEVAIETAKATLEEKFTPFLKEKLSQKINELNEESLDEVEEVVNEEQTVEENLDEVSLDELLAELETEQVDEAKKEDKEKEDEKDEKDEDDIEVSEMSQEELESFIKDVIKDMENEGEIENAETAEIPEETDEITDEEDINLEELLNELEEPEEKVDEMMGSDAYGSPEEIAAAIAIIASLVGATALSTKDIRTSIADAAKKGKEALKAKVQSLLSSKGKLDKDKELEEAYNTVKTLQESLNEINLLNVKLLYTNKIFRNQNLNENQKIQVITSLDKAKNKKEAQLVFETLQENLKSSKSSNTKKSSFIKENLGSSSKQISNNLNQKPIVQNDAFTRMQKLAGIIK